MATSGFWRNCSSPRVIKVAASATNCWRGHSRHARKAGATTKGLITFTFNVVSQGLYIRHGCFPRLPIYLVSVARDALVASLQGDKLRITPIEPTASHLKTLTQLDVSALGISREKHHRYLLNDSTMKGVFLHDGDHCMGYAYVSATGHVGPLGGRSKYSEMGPAFRTALDSGGSERSRAGVGLPSRCERSPRHCCRARHADYISDGAGVDARLWRLDPLSPTKSGLHVMPRFRGFYNQRSPVAPKTNEHSLVPEPCRRPEKVGGLAQVLQ